MKNIDYKQIRNKYCDIIYHIATGHINYLTGILQKNNVIFYPISETGVFVLQNPPSFIISKRWKLSDLRN